MGKKKVRENLCGLDERYKDVLTIDEFAAYLHDLSKPYEGKGYSHFALQYTAYYESSGWSLYGERDETDAEYNQRLKDEAAVQQALDKAAQKRLERDKKEYERLKRKFESKGKEK